MAPSVTHGNAPSLSRGAVWVATSNAVPGFAIVEKSNRGMIVLPPRVLFSPLARSVPDRGTFASGCSSGTGPSRTR